MTIATVIRKHRYAARFAAVALTVYAAGQLTAACSVEDTSGGGDDSSSSASGGSAATPDLTVASKTILSEFEDNEAAADAKYKGKTIRVNGFVAKIDTDIFDPKKYVIQVAPPGDYNFTSVNCNDQTEAAVTNLKKGQRISVVGKFDDGGDLGVELKKCAAVS